VIAHLLEEQEQLPGDGIGVLSGPPRFVGQAPRLFALPGRQLAPRQPHDRLRSPREQLGGAL
jgi:hypothetical protein